MFSASSHVDVKSCIVRFRIMLAKYFQDEVRLLLFCFLFSLYMSLIPILLRFYAL